MEFDEAVDDDELSEFDDVPDDEELPEELLPTGWNGLQAAASFAALRERLAGPARAHALAVIRR